MLYGTATTTRLCVSGARIRRRSRRQYGSVDRRTEAECGSTYIFHALANRTHKLLGSLARADFFRCDSFHRRFDARTKFTPQKNLFTCRFWRLPFTWCLRTHSAHSTHTQTVQILLIRISWLFMCRLLYLLVTFSVRGLCDCLNDLQHWSIDMPADMRMRMKFMLFGQIRIGECIELLCRWRSLGRISTAA